MSSGGSRIPMWFLTLLPRRRTTVDADPMNEDVEDFLAEEGEFFDPDEDGYDDDEHQFADDDDDAEGVNLPDHRQNQTNDETNDWEHNWSSHNRDEPTEEFDDDDGFVFDDDDESEED